MKVLFTLNDGQLTGGNQVAVWLMEAWLRKGHSALAAVPDEGPVTERIRELGIPVVASDLRKSFRRDAAFRLAVRIRREGVRLVHAHGPAPHLALACLAAKRAGTPAVAHFHLKDTLNRLPWIRAYQKQFFREAFGWEHVTCAAVSHATARSNPLLERTARPVTVIHNGVAEGPDAAACRVWLRGTVGAGRAPVLVHAGRLCESKGQHLSVEAMPAILGRHPGTTLVLAGEELAAGGAYSAALNRQIRALGLEGRVLLPGRRADIRRWIAGADALLLPSRTEGLPLVVIEAMMSAVPVVASRVDGIPELVEDGRDGWLVPPDDAPALAAAVLDALGDPGRREAMGRRAQQKARASFGVERMAERTFALYERALGRDEKK